MNFDAHMRVGSLEITAALLVVAAVAARPRAGNAGSTETLHRARVRLRVLEKDGERVADGSCPMILGRAGDADLPVRDAEASRRHARLEAHGRVIYLRDLQSRNGTFLNGARVTQAIEIRPGDEIDVGTTRLIVEEVHPWT